MDFTSLEIGNVVTVTLKNSYRLIGEFNGRKEQPKAIDLKNARMLHEDSCDTSYKIYQDVSVDCEHITKLEVLNENLALSGSSSKLAQAVEKFSGFSSTKPRLKPVKLIFRSDIQRELEQSMQDFCTMLFDNANFGQLLSNRGEAAYIGLPTYVVKLLHNPALPMVPYVQEIAENNDETTTALVKVENNGFSKIYEPMENSHADNYGCPLVTLEFDDDDDDDDYATAENDNDDDDDDYDNNNDSVNDGNDNNGNDDDDDDIDGDDNDELPQLTQTAQLPELPQFPHFHFRYVRDENQPPASYYQLVYSPMEDVDDEEHDPLMQEIATFMVNCHSMGGEYE